MKNKILNIISSSAEYISGEEISNKYGVSRTAIWKHINALKQEGYQIESFPRKGYKLIQRPDILLENEVLTNLNTSKWGKEKFYFLNEVDSTNNYAKKLASEGKPEGTVIVAEEQSAGKGRLSRKWISAKGKGIWTSFILRPNILPNFAAQITLVMAVGMIKALEKNLGVSAKIKWPNDILINDLKVCGILTEMSAEIDRINYVIVGIGLNVNQSNDDFPDEIQDSATSLKICLGKEIKRVQMLQVILEEIEKVYNLYLEKGFSEILDEWKNNSCTLGQEVIVKMPKEIIEGMAIDIDSGGCLIVKDKENIIHKIIAGDVLVRKK
ncbi:BirA family transcriptional regulator, biotin operon repressor / biotin-[acetyl-CoA-carboxylase] ligase [Desulfonispora thiosulfatigenes DSM 11270]|uniref:Bifunctional ligase/repressor BirA n=1 Tax=Desulfonispora thiosulfatigenes DSM 11270 TaxID=656914 RepID=A0A1W1VJK4_DESTI|nr:biotin--[acetyl-CoA-carboxylase] ligase [Desulfonispora thiosulfatigenes]SMB93463.1 BirA family transcriptional regulator, biotin operon repressor / biotin-[acetyl-CoA-carboxylase] ligase [Desulfonispora thiosulfatigenes DSM 11270]